MDLADKEYPEVFEGDLEFKRIALETLKGSPEGIKGMFCGFTCSDNALSSLLFPSLALLIAAKRISPAIPTNKLRLRAAHLKSGTVLIARAMVYLLSKMLHYALEAISFAQTTV
jgi:hypothetical protein